MFIGRIMKWRRHIGPEPIRLIGILSSVTTVFADITPGIIGVVTMPSGVPAIAVKVKHVG